MGDCDCVLVSSVVIEMSWKETEAMVVQPYISQMLLNYSL